MLERLFLTFLLVLLLSGACLLFKQGHLRRLRRVTAVTPAATAANQPTLLYFAGSSCMACPTQAHYLEQLAQTWPGRFTVQTIDAEAEPETAAQFGVFTLPTTMILDAAGVVREVNYGLVNSHKLARQLAAL